MGVEGDVEKFRIVLTVTAVSAFFRGAVVAEIAQDKLPQTKGRAAVIDHFLQEMKVVLSPLLAFRRVFDEELLGVDVPGGKEQQAFPRFSVPPGSPCLLIIGL